MAIEKVREYFKKYDMFFSTYEDFSQTCDKSQFL